MSEYNVALVLTVSAETYQRALEQADEIAEGFVQDGYNISAVIDYELDNDGQRVLYLDAA